MLTGGELAGEGHEPLAIIQGSGPDASPGPLTLIVARDHPNVVSNELR